MADYKGISKGMKALVWLCLAALCAACANMGRPEGGARDEIPPKFLRSDPMPGAKNVSKSRLTASFDENIQLEDAFTKVVVSPGQKTPPRVTANGKKLTVDFQDTLLPNTTYTIDFADAIKDLNEGNILDGFALDFTTGDTLDTLRISGVVLQAENLEPAQGMLVGAYANYTDTSLTTLPFDRIARTNQLGQFTIRNLKPGSYRIFAVNDVNRDYHWDKSEDVAFYDEYVSPTTEAITVTDTLFAANGEDSLVSHPGIRYLPNDLLLTWFNVGYKPLYMTDNKREDRRRIIFRFSAPMDTLPRITIADGAPGAGRSIDEWAVLKSNATRDSLEYWIADTVVMKSDSLRLAVSYLKTDTADRTVWTTDTLRFFIKTPKENKKDKKKKEDETPKFIVDSVTGDTTFMPPPDLEYLNIKPPSATQELNRPLYFEASAPIETIDTAGIHMEMQVDTLWQTIPFKIRTDSLNPLMSRRIDIDWNGGSKYRFTIDTLAIHSIYNTWNRPVKQELTVRQSEDYSSLRFSLPGLDTVQVVVELLSSTDAPQYRAVKKAGENDVVIKFINPGTYYARLFIDSNANGKWDTGNPVDSIALQPEEVYYFAKKLELKKNWDIEQTWLVDELAVDAQKPYAIKKNKPKLKRGEQAPGQDDDNINEEDMNYNPFDRTGRNQRGQRTNRSGNSGTYGRTL